jgi:ABC-2 type transport system permease protein
MVNTEEEGQQFQMPIIILLIFSFFIMFTVAQNPDTVKAYWISLVPFFTPVVMFARISVSDPVLPDGALLSIPVMIISTFLLLWVIAKIYRVGILMYGKKPSLKEAVKWIKYK